MSGPILWVPTATMVGKTIAHYQIIEKIGEGGMGVVYKARDSHLARLVAIKVLPPEKLADPERKRRFVQEAKAASALNHPNIVVVHDIASEDGTDFIVMEYVVGKTLNQIIPRKGMRLSEALKLAIQIADALAHAHAAGIVHRDLKPANIMVDDHGQAKILDFGLAKLSDRTDSSDEDTTTIKVKTDEGTIIGTAAYMSPEQAQGKPVDARSDIFSFGAMLYEMTTGHSAFQDDTQMATLASVISKEPKPPSQVLVALPRELDRIVHRCLRKDPARRFQVMTDLKVELEDLKTVLDSDSLTTEVSARPHRKRRWLVAAPVPLLALAGWFLLHRASAPLPPPGVVPLTSYPGSEQSPSFSPDGSQVAFSWDGEKQDNFDIYVRLVGGGTPLRLTTDPAPDMFPAWSPDGRYIAFVRRGGIYLISPLGGPERKLEEFRGTGSPPMSWSPDGKWLAVAETDPQGADGIFLVPVGRGEKRRLTSNPGFADHSPAFSPNGHLLAYASCTNYHSCDVNLLELDRDLLPKNRARALTDQHQHIIGIAWTADGRSVIYAAGQDLTIPYLWRVAISGTGKPERLDLTGPQSRHPAISRSGNRLAYDQGGADADIWKFEAGAPAKNFIASTLADGNPQFSPDGKKIVFASSRSGSGMEIWVCNRDGSNPVQLTDRLGRHQGSPRWSPDSRWIAFDSQGEDGRWRIYVIDAAGGQARLLTTQPFNENIPSWSRDGKWIYFRSGRSGKHEIWRTPAAGGESSQVTGDGGSVAFESWDGETLYYTKEGTGAVARLFAKSLAGGPEREVLDAVAWRAFCVVSDGIYYVAPAERKDAYLLLFFNFATRKSQTLTRIEGQPWWGLTISPDRRTVLFSVHKPINYDLMLIENFR
ncbi:MAG: serine/threonine-protein kinase [Acidobacteriales bacterium]|nr:serine/threonine-protein kinase [Terriglobales bacterium]